MHASPQPPTPPLEERVIGSLECRVADEVFGGPSDMATRHRVPLLAEVFATQDTHAADKSTAAWPDPTPMAAATCTISRRTVTPRDPGSSIRKSSCRSRDGAELELRPGRRSGSPQRSSRGVRAPACSYPAPRTGFPCCPRSHGGQRVLPGTPSPASGTDGWARPAALMAIATAPARPSSQPYRRGLRRPGGRHRCPPRTGGLASARPDRSAACDRGLLRWNGCPTSSPDRWL